MYYVVTLRSDASYNKLNFQFGSIELAASFIDNALICGENVIAEISIVWDDEAENNESNNDNEKEEN